MLALRFMLPLLMSLAWIVSVAMTVRRVLREKELGLKEIMRMMQVSRGHLWFSWFITSFLIMLISVVGLTLLLKVSPSCSNMWVHCPYPHSHPQVGKIFIYTDWLLLFLYLMLYSITVIFYR